MGNKKSVFIGIVIAALVIIVAVLVFLVVPGDRVFSLDVDIVTDKPEYPIEGALKVKIVNDMAETFCFSSCYPYYLEKKERNWEKYSYASCPGVDVVESCVSPKSVKAFEFVIPSVDRGTHRIAIPACVGCSAREAFRRDAWFFSNEFLIK